MMQYAFDKRKLPRDFSFPLKRSLLDAVLTQAQIARVHCVYYWLRQSGDIVLRADYCGETNQAWAAGQASITLYAVPSVERQGSSTKRFLSSVRGYKQPSRLGMSGVETTI
jgi:hypothetical protein